MYPFSRALRILDDAGAGGAGGAERAVGFVFSRKDGAAMSKPRFVPFRRIGLAVGEPVRAAAATPEGLHAQVLALRGDWK